MGEILREGVTARVTAGIDPRGSLTERIRLLGLCNPEDLDVLRRHFLATSGKPSELISSDSTTPVP